MNADTALHNAMQALVGHRVRVTELETPTYSRLLELFGSNAGIASAAGFPTAAAALLAGRDPNTARRQRQSFLRNLQRYERGRTPRGQEPRLGEIEQQERTKRRMISSLGQLARTMVESGATVRSGATLTIAVSQDVRERSGLPSVAVHPPEGFIDAVDNGRWSVAADLFFSAWGAGYGIGYVLVLDAEDLSIALGIQADAYGARSAA